MHRTDAPNHSSNLFVDRVPGVSAGTTLEQNSLNAFQEELANTVEADGTTLVKGTNTQLRSIISEILKMVIPGGRLTLTTALPVTTADVSGATTIYYTPFKGNKIPLYNGSRWVLKTFAELSNITSNSSTGKAGPAAVANNSNYDLFVWDDAGTVRLTRGPAWTSDTARGTGAGTTELELFEGRLVNKVAITNGPAARCGLYVGSVGSDGSAQINDTVLKRMVWNRNHRFERPVLVVESTDTWTYSSTTWRQVRATAANQADYLCGLSEDLVKATAQHRGTSSNGTFLSTGVGVDSTSVSSAKLTFITYAGAGAFERIAVATYQGFPGLGRHSLVWLERGSTGTTDFFGDAGVATDLVQTGLIGSVMA